MITFHRHDILDSTSNELRRMGREASHGTVVTCREQTAGRGQRGNSWEAEPGMNLTFSILLEPPELEATEQFWLSQAVAVAVAVVLNKVTGEEIMVKWPNDIYWNDRKLGGILIENSLSGTAIDRSIAGIGINVNQRVFMSDAPNPVSLNNITGQEYDTAAILEMVTGEIVKNVEELDNGVWRNYIDRKYRSLLWRGAGYHPFEATASGRRFTARVHDVAPSGILTLEEPDGTLSSYAFKEVVWL